MSVVVQHNAVAALVQLYGEMLAAQQGEIVAVKQRAASLEQLLQQTMEEKSKLTQEVVLLRQKVTNFEGPTILEAPAE